MRDCETLRERLVVPNFPDVVPSLPDVLPSLPEVLPSLPDVLAILPDFDERCLEGLAMESPAGALGGALEAVEEWSLAGSMAFAEPFNDLEGGSVDIKLRSLLWDDDDRRLILTTKSILPACTRSPSRSSAVVTISPFSFVPLRLLRSRMRHTLPSPSTAKCSPDMKESWVGKSDFAVRPMRTT